MAHISIAVKPFVTPNFVSAASDKDNSHTPCWSISQLDAETLSDLCDTFRAEVFKKAARVDPNPPFKATARKVGGL